MSKKIEDAKRKFSGLFVKKDIWFRKDLTWTEKILLCEIDSLDPDNKGCWASNLYLAEFLQVKESYIPVLLSELKKDGFIIERPVHKEDREDGKTRRISINFQAIRHKRQKKALLVKTNTVISPGDISLNLTEDELKLIPSLVKTNTDISLNSINNNSDLLKEKRDSVSDKGAPPPNPPNTDENPPSERSKPNHVSSTIAIEFLDTWNKVSKESVKPSEKLIQKISEVVEQEGEDISWWEQIFRQAKNVKMQSSWKPDLSWLLKYDNMGLCNARKVKHLSDKYGNSQQGHLQRIYDEQQEMYSD